MSLPAADLRQWLMLGYDGREMENFPDGERSEMVELYEAQGLSKTDATMVIDTMSKPEYAK